MQLDAVLSIQAAAAMKVCPICKANLPRQDMAAHLKQEHVGKRQEASRREAPMKDSARQRGFYEPRQRNALQRMREIGEIPRPRPAKIAKPMRRSRPAGVASPKRFGGLPKMHLAADYSGPGAIEVNKYVRADASASDVAHQHSLEEPSATDTQAIQWKKKRQLERLMGRNLEVGETMAGAQPDCGCPLKIGDRIRVDGMLVRGLISSRTGRQLALQMDNGLNLQRDQRWVHAE